MADEQPPSGLPSQAEFKLLVANANSGDAAALTSLRALLDGSPELWQRLGNLANHTERLLIGLIAGADKLLEESLSRKAEAMRQELAGSSPSLLEELAVQRIVGTWLQLQYVESMVLKAVAGSKPANFWLKRQAQADRSYTAAMKSFGLLRQFATPKAPRVNSSDAVLPIDEFRTATG